MHDAKLFDGPDSVADASFGDVITFAEADRSAHCARHLVVGSGTAVSIVRAIALRKLPLSPACLRPIHTRRMRAPSSAVLLRGA
jgi:hypothetical protein